MAFPKYKRNFLAAPKIKVPERYAETLLFDKGETIKLKMTFTGRPVPQVTWTKDDDSTPLTSGDKYTIDSTNDTATFIVKNAEKSDRGKYILTISNEIGQDTASVEVNITDRPDPPTKPTISDVNLDSVKVRWSPPVHDGGSAVRVYHIEKCQEGTEQWEKTETSKQPNVSLYHLDPNAAYKFRVRAENVFGISEPSEPSDLVQINEVKREVSIPPKEKTRSPSPEIVEKEKKRKEPSPPKPLEEKMEETTVEVTLPKKS